MIILIIATWEVCLSTTSIFLAMLPALQLVAAGMKQGKQV
jgi:hypothetical protein